MQVLSEGEQIVSIILVGWRTGIQLITKSENIQLYSVQTREVVTTVTSLIIVKKYCKRDSIKYGMISTTNFT